MSEGGRAILTCVIGDLGGRVQWTKDGLTLGAEFMIGRMPRVDDGNKFQRTWMMYPDNSVANYIDGKWVDGLGWMG